jgi:hypothetical protein
MEPYFAWQMSRACNSKSYPVDYLAMVLIRHQISLKLSAKALLTEQSSLRLEVRDVTNGKIGARYSKAVILANISFPELSRNIQLTYNYNFKV